MGAILPEPNTSVQSLPKASAGLACATAIAFWQAAAGDRRIGKDFRATCAGNVDELMRLRDQLQGRLLPSARNALNHEELCT